MMLPNDILQYLRAQPFQPFRIVMNSGRAYDVRHPEMVKVGFSTLFVFTNVVGHDEIVEKMDMVSLALIEYVELIETPQSTKQPA